MNDNKYNTVVLSDDDISKCKIFSLKVIQDTYNRFNQNKMERQKRIFIGKIGEIAFQKFLNLNNKFVDVKNMFTVFKGETNVDKFDFVTKENKTIDIKTAYKNFHKRIIIPWDQFEQNNSKDYYVGTKLNHDFKSIKILGYTTKNQIMKNGKLDFGEGLGYYEYLNKLTDIRKLLEEI